MSRTLVEYKTETDETPLPAQAFTTEIDESDWEVTQVVDLRTLEQIEEDKDLLT